MANTQRDDRPILPQQESRHGKTGYIGDVQTFKPAATRDEERKRLAKAKAPAGQKATGSTKAKAGPAEAKDGTSVDADPDGVGA